MSPTIIALVVLFVVLFIIVMIIVLWKLTSFNIGKDARSQQLSRYLAHHRGAVKVVFTLSTLPSRIHMVHETVKELLASTVLPDAVYLNVPTHCRRLRKPYVLTAELRALALSDSRFRLNIDCEDYGPATKLLPTLQAELDPDTILITADDDIYYPASYHEELLEQSIRHPEVAFGYRGVVFKNNQPIFLASNPGPTQVLEGFTGAIYRRKFFTDSIFDIDKTSPCFFTDDIYISAHLAQNKVNRTLLMGEPHNVGMGRKGLPIKQKKVSKQDPLHINNHTGRNQACFMVMSQHFEKI